MRVFLNLTAKRIHSSTLACQKLMLRTIRFEGFRVLSMSQSTHLEKTEGVARNQEHTDATVLTVKDETPTIKKLTLSVENETFSFKAGQWVDFFIPEVNTVGGFSMCSAPNLLKDNRRIELAVKRSSHPPADWVHTKCKEGCKVHMKAGGNFFYDPPVGSPRKNLLLIAGGVGVNPLFSILQHAKYLNRTMSMTNARPHKTLMLYSAKSLNELIFKDQIDAMIKEDDSIHCRYFTTEKKSCLTETSNILAQRIDLAAILSSVDFLQGANQMECFICGPLPMIETMSLLLKNVGLDTNMIHFEKWW